MDNEIPKSTRATTTPVRGGWFWWIIPLLLFLGTVGTVLRAHPNPVFRNNLGSEPDNNNLGTTSSTAWTEYRSADGQIIFRYPGNWRVSGNLTNPYLQLDSVQPEFTASIIYWATPEAAFCTNVEDCIQREKYLPGTISSFTVGGYLAVRGIANEATPSDPGPFYVGHINIFLSSDSGYSIDYRPPDSPSVADFDTMLTSMHFGPK